MLIELVNVRNMCKSGQAREIREAADVSLAEVADVIGVSPTTVYRWETGKSLPRVEHAASYWTVLQDLRGATRVADALFHRECTRRQATSLSAS